MKRLPWRALSQLLIWSLVLLLFWWLLRTVTIADLLPIFQRLTLGNIALLVLANLVVLITLCGRWWLFLNGAGYSLPFWRLLGYRVAAFAVSYFTPGPHLGGEPLQVYLVSKRHGVPPAVAIATVTLDKILELVINFLVLGAGLVFLLQQPQLATLLAPATLYLAFALSLLPIVLLLALFASRHALVRWVTQPPRATRTGVPFLAKHLNRWLHIIEQSELRIMALWRSNPRLFVIACGISLLSWAALIGEFWYMTSVLGLALSFREAFTLLLAMRVAILLPMPAGLGAVEAGLTLVTTALGLPPATGLGLSLLIRLRDVSLGLIGLWLAGGVVWRRANGPAPGVTTVPSEPPFPASPLLERWPHEDVAG